MGSDAPERKDRLTERHWRGALPGRPGALGSGVSTAVMVAAALAVAGCGGGGGGAPTTTTTTTGEKTPAQLADDATKALDAAKAAVGMVTVSADRAKVTDADTAMKKARAAVAAASGADSHAALSKRLMALEASLAKSLTDRGTAQRTALETASKALTTALTALDPKGDGSTVEQFTAATEALAALEKAVADATDLTDAQKKAYRDAVASANGPRLRERRVDRIVRHITETEIAAAREAVASNAEDAATRIAEAKERINAADIPEAEKGKLLAKVQEQEDALDERKRIAREADMEKRRAMGRALYAAMGPSDDTTAPVNALNNLATVPYYITSITDSQHDAPAEATGQRGERGDFRIDPAAGAGSIATANTHTAVFFRHGMEGRDGHDTSMDKVGRWHVTDYKRTTGSGSMKVTDRVRVYNDRQGGPLERWGVVPMDAAKFFKDDTDWTNKGTYTPADRKLSLGTGVDRAVASETFDKWTVGIGSVTAPKPADGGAEIKVPGTYYGAPGNYFCPVSGTCTVGTGVGGGGFGGYFLSADWYFVHDAGAKVLERDLSYMYFGWWVRDDADGMPAAVSAFYQAVGGGVELSTDGKSLNVNRGRAATYEGPAIGWYAINDPLNEKGDGGEFTATANLKAQFGTANLNADTGLTGTIDRFSLKGGSGDPGWSVTLNKAAWTTDPSLATDAQKGHIVNTEKTVWSINGVKAAPAGSWVANLYDDKPGTVENGGDGSNHPTAIMGKWQAGHGGTHRMVGAFGTELQAP